MFCGKTISNQKQMSDAKILDCSEQIYRLDPAISQSDLGLFKESPDFYRAVKFDGAEGFSSSGFRIGSAFDVFFLSPDEFDELYVVQPAFDESPSSPQQNSFCDLMVSGYDYLSAYKECGYKIDGKTDAAIQKAAEKLRDDLSGYIEFFKTVDGRIILNQGDHDTLVLMRQSLENHPHGDLLSLPHDGETVFNQLKLRWTEMIDYEDSVENVEMKGMLDKLIIQLEKKKIIIYDVKTTAKSWKQFVNVAIPAYGYDLQQTVYSGAVAKLLMNLLEDKDDFANWTIECRIVGVQTKGRNEARVFKITPKVIEEKTVELHSLLSDILWHTKTGKWLLPKAAYLNDGMEDYDGSR